MVFLAIYAGSLFAGVIIQSRPVKKPLRGQGPVAVHRLVNKGKLCAARMRACFPLLAAGASGDNQCQRYNQRQFCIFPADFANDPTHGFLLLC